MNTPQTIEADADRAVQTILAGLGEVHPFVQDRIRKAYMLGRMEANASTASNLIRIAREQAEKHCPKCGATEPNCYFCAKEKA